MNPELIKLEFFEVLTFNSEVASAAELPVAAVALPNADLHFLHYLFLQLLLLLLPSLLLLHRLPLLRRH